MTNQNMNFDDDLMSMDDLDAQIEALHTRPHLIDKIQNAKADKEKADVDTLSFKGDFRKHWALYLFLAISALFTGTLAIYMGLSPTLLTQADGSTVIHFNTDITHVALAIAYFLAFIAVTEIAFSIAKYLYYAREDGNTTQANTMIIMMIVSGLSVLLTGVAGGTVIASFVSFMSAFVEVPVLAQKWIVTAIPLLIVVYAFLLTPYALSSEEARSKRTLREQKRKNEVDHELRKETMLNFGAEILQKEELKRYVRLVQDGKISAADANAAILAGKTLGVLERDQNRDIDGDGHVGAPRALPNISTVPQPILRSAPLPEPSYHPRNYTLQEFLNLIGYSKAEAQAVLARNGDLGVQGAWNLLNTHGMIPLDMVFENFEALYAELFPTPAERPNGLRRS